MRKGGQLLREQYLLGIGCHVWTLILKHQWRSIIVPNMHAQHWQKWSDVKSPLSELAVGGR